MATITEDYCDFETAKLLKEKGFVIPLPKDWVFCMYDESGNTQWGCYHSDWYPRITLQMAMKWLREVHSIHIVTVFLGHSLKWTPTIWKIDMVIPESKHVKSTFNTWETYEEACEAAIKYCLEKLI